MTLVWNQRTTLENEGGGGKGSQGGATGARQSTSAVGGDYGRGHAHRAPAQLLRLPAQEKKNNTCIIFNTLKCSVCDKFLSKMLKMLHSLFI